MAANPPVVKRPREAIPTRAQYAAAGYAPETYDQRFGADAIPNLLTKPATDTEEVVFTELNGNPFFCTDAKHPGADGRPLDMFDLARVFFVDPFFEACPVCPACKKQVSAIPLTDAATLPPGLQAVKDRLDGASRT